MKFLGANGYDSEREAAHKTFFIGEPYLVEDCKVDAWSHSIKFVGKEGRHNGVMFERCPMPPADHSTVTSAECKSE